MTTQNKNVPALRFSEFQDEWKEKDLGELADVTTGNKDTQNRIDDGKHPFFVRSQTVERINSYSFDGEAILTSGDGVGVGKNFHYINGKFDFHQRVYCLNNFKNQVSGRYIFFYFAEKFNKRVMRLSAKNSVDSVRRDMIVDMPINLPTLPEQQKIAAFLTAVDEKIQQLTKKKDLLEQYKKGVMQKIFNQEIRFKDDNGNDFADWEEKPLGTVAKLYQPVTISQSQFTDEGYDVFGANGIIGKFSKFNHKEIQVTVSCRGENSGQVNLTPAFCWITGNSMVANIEESKENILIDFFYYSLSSVSLKYLVTGSGQPQITRNNLTKHKIYLPEIIEQQKIANFLSAIDDKINLVNQQLGKTKEYKKGLLQQMFI